jgi:hypothetical protein
MRAQAAKDGRGGAPAPPADQGGLTGGRGVPGSCLLQSLLAAPFCRACAGVFPWSGERWGGTRVTWFGAAGTNARSRVVTYDHARRAVIPARALTARAERQHAAACDSRLLAAKLTRNERERQLCEQHA